MKQARFPSEQKWLMPGFGYSTQPKIEFHYHLQGEETFVCLSGQMVLYVNGRHYEMNKGDAIRVEPGEVHSIIAHSRDVSYLLFMSPAGLTNDKVVVDTESLEEMITNT